MANVSNDLTTLDFNSIKENLKSYLKSQPIFQDYDFEASNINVLLDILAYNTNLNAFYLNMIANEMFLDSALLRDSIISHAKELNYLPRSFRSATAEVDIFLRDNSNDASIIIPRGTTFTGTSGNRNFTFVTAENIQAKSVNTTSLTEPNFVAEAVTLYEGDYTKDTYVVNTLNPVRYIITNKTVDTDSIIVSVIEDNGEVVQNYLRRDSLFGLDAQSKVFFIQPAENDTYEILFGDGVIGRPPKDNSIVVIEYRACNGELPNGIRTFTADDNIGTAVVRQVVTRTDEVTGKLKSAIGGSIPESIESIKLNAPRAFTTQERVVSASDYSTLLKANFSEINDVYAYGGEEANPPRFGKVVVAVDLKESDALPETLKAKYRQFIKPRSPLAIDPVFVAPNYLYATINTKVKYNINQTNLNIDDIKSLVLSAISTYNNNEINGFGKTLHYSRLVAAIDNAQASIVSNDTQVLATKTIQPSLLRSSYVIEFNMALVNNIGSKGGDVPHSQDQISVVTSSPFIFANKETFIEDDGEGNMKMVQTENGKHTVINTIGTVDYNTGRIQLNNLQFGELINGSINFTVLPRQKDITATKNSIIRVLNSDITVEIEQVRI